MEPMEEKNDSEFDKLFEEVLQKQTQGCYTQEDVNLKECERLREENRNMSDSLRRLRQMRANSEKEKNTAEAENIKLRAEISAMALRIRELEETILNERLKKWRGAGQIVKNKSSSSLDNLSTFDNGSSSSVASGAVLNSALLVVAATGTKRAYGSDPRGGSQNTVNAKRRGRPPTTRNHRDSSLDTEQETMMLVSDGSDLIAAMSTNDSFSEGETDKPTRKKASLSALKRESDDEAEFEGEPNEMSSQNRSITTTDHSKTTINSSSTKKATSRQSTGKAVKSMTGRSSAHPLPPNPSTWSLNDHCAAVVTTRDPDLKLSSLQFLLKRFENGSPSITGMLNIKLHEMLGIIIAERKDGDEIVRIALMVLNNLIARCKTPEFQKVAATCDLVPPLVKLIGESRNQDLQEHAMWVLDNLALKRGEFRTQALEEGILSAVLNILSRSGVSPKKVVIEHASNLLCSLSEGGEFWASEWVDKTSQLVRALSLLLKSKYSKGEVTAGVTNTLVHLLNTGGDETSESSDETEQQVEERKTQLLALVREVLADDTIPSHMMGLLTSSRVDDATCVAALDVVSALAAECTEQQVGTLLSLNLVEKLGPMLVDDQRDGSVRANACECLSNVCRVGGAPAIQTVLDADLLPILMELTTRDANAMDDETAVYATYCVLFALQVADLTQTQQLVDLSCLPVVCKLLEVGGARGGNKDLVAEAVRTIGILLRKFRYLSDFDHVASIVESAGGWESVTRLRLNKDARIRQLAVELDLDALRATYPTSGPLCNNK